MSRREVCACWTHAFTTTACLRGVKKPGIEFPMATLLELRSKPKRTCVETEKIVQRLVLQSVLSRKMEPERCNRPLPSEPRMQTWSLLPAASLQRPADLWFEAASGPLTQCLSTQSDRHRAEQELEGTGFSHQPSYGKETPTGNLNTAPYMVWSLICLCEVCLTL